MFAAKKYINTNIDEQLNIPNNDPSEAVKSAITYYIPILLKYQQIKIVGD